MEKQKHAKAAAIVALFLICLACFGFFFSGGGRTQKDYTVQLPGSSTAAAIEESPQHTVPEHAVLMPEITSENVQQVVASLARPIEYKSTVNSIVHAGESKRKWDMNVYVKSGARRIEKLSLSGTPTQISLSTAEKIYVWNNGQESNYWTTAAGTFSGDMQSMIPSYEDVIFALPEAILQAELLDAGEEQPSIQVTIKNGMQITEYTISSVSGLLTLAKIYENDHLVREVRISSEESSLDDALFTLAGSNAPVYEAT